MKTIVVMPAYNAAATLRSTINDIPLASVDELLLVDDASKDNTCDTLRHIVREHPSLRLADEPPSAGTIPCTIIRHERNTGYGGNQKTCYREALARGGDIIVMLHPDYQYDPRLITHFVAFIRDGYFSVMLGSRIRSREEALAGGMPQYKYYANRALTFIQNVASGRSLGEWHTGMRAYRREVLEAIPFHTFSNDFIFDTQMLFAIVEHGYAMGDIPVPVRYFTEASSINFARSCRYGILTLWETAAFVYREHRRPLRYLVAGALSVLANLALYTLLLKELHWMYLAAATIAFCFGGVVSFTLHKLWTFRHKHLKSLGSEILRYIAFVCGNAALNGTLVYLFVHYAGTDAWCANIYSNIVVAVWGYLALKHLVFLRYDTPA